MTTAEIYSKVLGSSSVVAVVERRNLDGTLTVISEELHQDGITVRL